MDLSYRPVGVSAEDLRVERACFYGTLLAALAYGALLMLYIQLAQVLLARPKRGQTFWAVVAYSGTLFPLVTLGIGLLFRISELSYIDNRNYPGGPSAFYHASSSDYVNVIGHTSTTLFPWLADILMLYRLMVIWNHNWWVLAFPMFVYVSTTAVSVPLLISHLIPTWESRLAALGISYHTLIVAFNIYMTIMICFRLCSIRRKLEVVAGKLHASFYTSTGTMFVESGAFFTLWATVYLILHARGSLVQDVFLLPFIYTLGIARMLVVLRIAQDRAWSKDLVMATDRGVLDWQVSSTHSVPLHDLSSNSMASFNVNSLPRKLREDSTA